MSDRLAPREKRRADRGEAGSSRPEQRRNGGDRPAVDHEKGAAVKAAAEYATAPTVGCRRSPPSRRSYRPGRPSARMPRQPCMRVPPPSPPQERRLARARSPQDRAQPQASSPPGVATPTGKADACTLQVVTMTVSRVRRSARKGLLILAPLFVIAGAGEPVANAATRAAPAGARVLVRQQLEPKGGDARGGQFGTGIAISGDGKTLLVGAPGSGGSGGTASVFTRTPTGWSQQGKLAVVTGPRRRASGRAWRFRSTGPSHSSAIRASTGIAAQPGRSPARARSGSGRRQVRRPAGAGSSSFGTGVALSANGKVALIGGPDDNRNAGAAWVFVRKGSEVGARGRQAARPWRDRTRPARRERFAVERTGRSPSSAGLRTTTRKDRPGSSPARARAGQSRDRS